MTIYDTLKETPALKRCAHIGKMPVPWVTCYRDGSDAYDVRRTADGAAYVCDCVPGEGKPILGQQCPSRQRRAMSERRCSSCGDRIKGVALFPGVYIHVAQGFNVPPGTALTAEAPTHPRCLAYSALACPRLDGAPSTLVVPVIGDYPLLDRWRFVDPGGDEEDELDYDFYPPNTRRPEMTNDGKWPIQELVYARLDGPGRNVTTLDAWMRRNAAEPYRSLWSESREPALPLGALYAPPVNHMEDKE